MVPSEVMPRRHYAATAIALAIALYGLAGEPHAEVRRRVSPVEDRRRPCRGAFADVKRRLRAPAINAARANPVESARAWVDTWYSPEAQRRLAEAAARLRK